MRSGRLHEATRHICRKLADPDLTPTTAAIWLGVSVRTLHAAFEATGGSFFRYVQNRRLDECYAALLAQPDRAVTDVAFGWGFNSMSSFYRAFRAQFGTTPSQLRATLGAERDVVGSDMALHAEGR